ncbi:MAG TPA: hypothetical protein VLH10_10600 [Yinghuangia sp.]|nr:hypothetical protein [Yinghuangia sp.]
MFAAPNLIIHYVIEHDYGPPEEFSSKPATACRRPRSSSTARGAISYGPATRGHRPATRLRQVAEILRGCAQSVDTGPAWALTPIFA